MNSELLALKAQGKTDEQIKGMNIAANKSNATGALQIDHNAMAYHARMNQLNTLPSYTATNFPVSNTPYPVNSLGSSIFNTAVNAGSMFPMYQEQVYNNPGYIPPLATNPLRPAPRLTQAAAAKQKRDQLIKYGIIAAVIIVMIFVFIKMRKK